MQQTLGALVAFAVLALILIGPLYLAVNAADGWPSGVARCASDMSCEPLPGGFPGNG